MADKLHLVDTHTHIHGEDYKFSANDVVANSAAMGVNTILTMGSDVQNSRLACELAAKYSGQHGVTVMAGVGLYPQDVAGTGESDIEALQQLVNEYGDYVCGVGEIGLDYYYDTTPREQQITALERLIQLATDNNLPMSFHVRSGRFGNAFSDFFAIISNFPKVTGVLHSFTDSLDNMKRVLDAGLYLGVNGIITFNREPELNAVYEAMPLDRVVLETDAPYLAPTPYRGKVNQPCYIRAIAESLASRRHLPLSDVAEITTANAAKAYPRLAC